MANTNNPFTPEELALAGMTPTGQEDHQGAITAANPTMVAEADPTAGFTPEELAMVGPELKEARYGGVGEQVRTGVEGALDAASFGTAGALTDALGVSKKEDRLARMETNPGSRMVGQGVGLVGSAFIPGAGAANVMERAGAAGAKALLPKTAMALGEEAALLATAKGATGAAAEAATLAAAQVAPTVAYKVGSAAVKSAIENAVFQGGDEVAKLLAGDPNQSMETAITDMGLAATIGGAFGGGIAAVNPLWKATVGKQFEGVLGAAQKRLGGRESVIGDDVTQLLDAAGVNAAPEVKAAMSSDPAVRAMATGLNQTDISAAGHQMQAAQDGFRRQLSDSVVEGMGFDPKNIPTNVSDYKLGRQAGDTLAKEVEERMGPISAEYDAIYKQVEGAPIIPSIADKLPEIEAKSGKVASDIEKLTRKVMKAQKSGSVEEAVEVAAKLEEKQQELRMLRQSAQAPGTIDRAGERIMQLANDEGWSSSASSDVMKKVNQVLKELPDQKSLKNLTQFISQTGDNFASDMTNKPLLRAGAKIKAILREEEALLIENHLGDKAGSEMVDRFRNVQREFAKHASVKDELQEIIGAKGSVSGYAKAIKDMASNDAEKLLTRLGRDGDAAALKFISENFPKTAADVRRANMTLLMEKAANSAKNGHSINVAQLDKMIKGLSPEMQEFLLPGVARGKLEAVGQLLEKLNDKNHNFSNTARVVERAIRSAGGNIMGLVTGLATGNPAAGLAAKLIGDYVGKEAPDAARLAMLKFLGSDAPVSTGGIKAMVDYFQMVIKGEQTTGKAIKNVFKAGVKVLPQALEPSHRDIHKLDEALKKMQANPDGTMSAIDRPTDLGHYMDDHVAAGTMATSNIASFINSQRPNTTPKLPMDAKAPLNPVAKSEFNNLLTIAQQPLVVLERVKNGSITSKDVTAMRTMYPALYQKVNQKMMENLMEHMSKGETLPYATRMGMSLFMGQPLDSTMTPMAIMGAQPAPPQQPGGGAHGGTGVPTKAPPATAMKALQKMSGSYLTADQARATRGQRIK